MYKKISTNDFILGCLTFLKHKQTTFYYNSYQEMDYQLANGKKRVFFKNNLPYIVYVFFCNQCDFRLGLNKFF